MKFFIRRPAIKQSTAINVILLFVTIGTTFAAYSTSTSTSPRDGRAKGIAGNLFGNNWSFSPSGRCKIKIFIICATKKLKCLPIVLSLFTVVQWGQSLCQAPSGEYGSCVPNNECTGRGGISGGPCAEGYGMCCVCKIFFLI